MIFLDGTGITPGSEGCQCGSECDFPCWQRLGWAPACSGCSCDIDTGYTPPGRQIGPLHIQTNAWHGLDYVARELDGNSLPSEGVEV